MFLPRELDMVVKCRPHAVSDAKSDGLCVVCVFVLCVACVCILYVCVLCVGVFMCGCVQVFVRAVCSSVLCAS